MRFMMRDFSAICKLGQLLIAESDNPQNEAAARKLIYGLARFVSEAQIGSVTLIASHLDLPTCATILTTLGEEELEWALGLLHEIATINGKMNQSQEHIWQHIVDTIENKRCEEDNDEELEFDL